MAFIKVQKLKMNDDGVVIGGSAAIVESKYQPQERVKPHGNAHSKHVVREKLGKVVWLANDRKKGIFSSPDRGLVEYSVQEDSFVSVSLDDPRIANSGRVQRPRKHVVFGDIHWLLCFLKQNHMSEILAKAFPDKSFLSRVYLHILHTILKDGGRISCDNFIAKSVASYIFHDISISSLHCDSKFFDVMGDEATRLSFFKAYVTNMKKRFPDFGNGCYIDSTPLPNEAKDNPLNYFCSHGTDSAKLQTRLALVLDKTIGRTVWYTALSGNINDINTLKNIKKDVYSSIGITIKSFILDAGYISKELIHTMCSEEGKDFIGRMPNRKGFQYKELFNTYVKPFISKLKGYQFFRGGHTYFGNKTKWNFWGDEVYAYLYVDKNNALNTNQDFHNKNQDEMENMNEEELFWHANKGGYFVLLSNIDKNTDEILDNYLGRVEIEYLFKTAKEYIGLLPLSKWTDQRIKGKILLDIICTNILLDIRNIINKDNIPVSELWGRLQSLTCFSESKNNIRVVTPNKKVKLYYQYLDDPLPPETIDIQKMRQDLHLV